MTTEPPATASRRDKDRWAAFLDVSRLFGNEYGPSRYNLFVAATLHDRWLVFDDSRIYSLGGSAKDAGKKDPFTLAHIEPTAENLALVGTTISHATEWFGATVTVHT